MDSCAPGTVYCNGCGDPTTVADTYPTGSRCGRRVEKVCKSILQTLYNSKKKCPATLTAFKKKSKQDQQAYVKSKKLQKAREGKYTFDDLVVSETQTTRSGEEARRRFMWTPYSKFYNQQLENAVTNQELDVEDSGEMEFFDTDVLAKWQAKVDKAKMIKWFGAVLHIGEYLGVIEDIVEASFFDSSVQRGQSTADAENIREVVANSEKTHKRMRFEADGKLNVFVDKDVKPDIPTSATVVENNGSQACQTLLSGMLRDLQRKTDEDTELDSMLLKSAEIETRKPGAKVKRLWQLKLQIKTMESKVMAKVSASKSEVEAKLAAYSADVAHTLGKTFEGAEEYEKDVSELKATAVAACQEFREAATGVETYWTNEIKDQSECRCRRGLV